MKHILEHLASIIIFIVGFGIIATISGMMIFFNQFEFEPFVKSLNTGISIITLFIIVIIEIVSYLRDNA